MSVFDYAVVLAMAGGVALVATQAFAKGPEDAMRAESACVKTFTCEKARGASGASSLAPQERHGANAVWEGVRSEADIAVSEVESAVRSPGDVVRGVQFIVDHPGVAMKAMLVRNAGRSPAGAATVGGASTETAPIDTAEEGGRGAVRVAAALGPASLGRIAKIGAMVGRHGTVLWELPPAPNAPDDPLGAPLAGPPAPLAARAADDVDGGAR